MKQALTTVIIILLGTQLIQGQKIDTPINQQPLQSHDLYMQKHKTNKTFAWILGGSGVTMTLAGLVINGAETAVIDVFTLGTGGVEKERKGDWLIYTGGAVTLASIPFIISSGKNKRKASMSLQSETVGYSTFEKYRYLAISYKIQF